jgi:predicted nuclease of predicted toxin-antitoxin system
VSKQKVSITFFIDHCVSQKIVPEAMRSAGALVEAHIDYFPVDALDIEWLPEVSRRGWVVITKDWGLSSNLLEQKAIASANARVFILASGNYTGEQMAAILVSALDRLQKFVRGNQAPFIARIASNGQKTQPSNDPAKSHHSRHRLRLPILQRQPAYP